MTRIEGLMDDRLWHDVITVVSKKLVDIYNQFC